MTNALRHLGWLVAECSEAPGLICWGTTSFCPSHPPSNQVFRQILATSVLLVLAGCGGTDSSQRYRLSGSVTFGGQPVPAGTIIFEPDASLGNAGPGILVEFTDGRYRTPRGKGTVGGPHLVRIVGHDGKAISEMPLGRCLFQEYQFQIDLPRHDATHDFDVPANDKHATCGEQATEVVSHTDSIRCI